MQPPPQARQPFVPPAPPPAPRQSAATPKPPKPTLPAPPKPLHRAPRSYFGPVVLMIIGALWLLHSFGIELNWGVVLPLVLIVLGLLMVLMRGFIGGWAVSLVIILALAGLAYSFFLSDAFDQVRTWTWFSGTKRIETTTRDLAVSRDAYPDAKALDVSTTIGSGTVNVSSVPTETSWFSSVATYNYQHLAPDLDVSERGETLVLDYYTSASVGDSIFSFGNQTAEYEVMLAQPEIPTSLEMHLGSGTGTIIPGAQALTHLTATVGSGELTVTAEEENTVAADGTFKVGSGSLLYEQAGLLKLTKLSGIVGSGDATILYGDSMPEGISELSVTVGSGDLKLRVPSGTGLRISPSVGSGHLNLNGEPLDEDAVYASPGYDDATFRLDVRVTVGSGDVEVTYL